MQIISLPRRLRPRADIEPAEDLVPQHRRDWFRVLSDLQRAGVNNAEVARRLRLSDTTVRNWKYGIEPIHSRGEALLELHARTCAAAGLAPGPGTQVPRGVATRMADALKQARAAEQQATVALRLAGPRAHGDDAGPPRRRGLRQGRR